MHCRATNDTLHIKAKNVKIVYIQTHFSTIAMHEPVNIADDENPLENGELDTVDRGRCPVKTAV